MSQDNTPAVTSFQYELVDKPTASKLQMLANEISFIDRMACFEIGARLKAARDELKANGELGGGFNAWVETETNYSRRAAYDLIQISENLSRLFVHDRAQMNNNDSHLSSFNYATLRQMASPSYPEEARTQLIEAAKAGEKITEKDAKAAKEEILRAQQEAEQAKRETEEMRQLKAEQDRKIADLQAQQQEASARLERAKEEYLKLKNKDPEIKIIEKEVVPKPYISLEQALQGKRNLMEDAEAAMRKAKAEEQRARDEIGKLKVELIKERHAIDKVRNDRTIVEKQRLILTNIKQHLYSFLKNNEENLHELDPDYLQVHDIKTLENISESLHRMTELVDGVIGGGKDYAEFRVING